MSDTQQLIGKLVDGSPERDAVHVAVVAVEAHEELAPGTHVGFDQSSEISSRASVKIGVVDPFLQQVACPGDKFWLFLYPNTITSLNHHWTHPAFPGHSRSRVGSVTASELWLRDYCSRTDCPPYETLLAILMDEPAQDQDGYGIGGRIDENYFRIGGVDASGEIPPQFWDHAEAVTGRQFRTRPQYFSCSC